MVGKIRKLICKYWGCTHCSFHETKDGCGGKCIHCGKIHGWTTRAELRAACERIEAKYRALNG
jgi:hypothetical protein